MFLIPVCVVMPLHSNNCSMQEKEPHLKAGLDAIQSHPLYRMCFSQNQASSAALEWLGDGNCSLIHEMLIHWNYIRPVCVYRWTMCAPVAATSRSSPSSSFLHSSFLFLALDTSGWTHVCWRLARIHMLERRQNTLRDGSSGSQGGLIQRVACDCVMRKSRWYVCKVQNLALQTQPPHHTQSLDGTPCMYKQELLNRYMKGASD